MAGIEARLKALIETPLLGVDRSDLRQGLRASIVGRHVIYYRSEDGFIYVLTVLHHSQDHEAFFVEVVDDSDNIEQ